MAFAYDPVGADVYMFFGDDNFAINCNPAGPSFVDEIWAFDTSTRLWTPIQGQGMALPLARSRSLAAWDATNNRAVVFGGRWRAGTSGPYTYLDDLWAFDPATDIWTELSALSSPQGPSGRMNFSMKADPARSRILIHGGGTTDFISFFPNNETWAFDLTNNTWSQIGTTGAPPPERLFHSAAIDESRGRLYVFGGAGADALISTNFYRDLWMLDFASDLWTEIPTNAMTFPPGLIKAELAYDAVRDRLLLMGGHDDTNLGITNRLYSFDLVTQTWNTEIVGDVYNQPPNGFCDFPAEFTIYDSCSPERRESHLFLIEGDNAWMFGGRTDCGLANDTWRLDLTNDSWRRINDSQSGMTCYRAGFGTCDDPGATMCGG